MSGDLIGCGDLGGGLGFLPCDDDADQAIMDESGDGEIYCYKFGKES